MTRLMMYLCVCQGHMWCAFGKTVVRIWFCVNLSLYVQQSRVCPGHSAFPLRFFLSAMNGSTKVLLPPGLEFAARRLQLDLPSVQYTWFLKTKHASNIVADPWSKLSYRFDIKDSQVWKMKAQISGRFPSDVHNSNRQLVILHETEFTRLKYKRNMTVCVFCRHGRVTSRKWVSWWSVRHWNRKKFLRRGRSYGMISRER